MPLTSPDLFETAPDLPDEIAGPQAWYSKDLQGREDLWLHSWQAEEIAEIEMAVSRILNCGLDILDISAADFDIPNITARLAQVKDHILNGSGFYVLRGLPVERWDLRQAATAFWGLSSHLGQACSQNGKGHVLGHVKNLGLDYNRAEVRGYQTSARLPFHTDISDIASLLCWRPAKSGGASSLASSTTLFNEIRKQRPDLLEVLMQPFQRTRWGEIPEGKDPWSEVPVFMPVGKRMIVQYVRSAIQKGQELPGIAPLTDIQVEALDFIDSLVEDPRIHLDMDFQPGDIQMVCNHSIMHSRTSFEDFEEPERRRHLLRLWLACSDGPELPDWILHSYDGSTEHGRPNGIVVPGVPFIAPLEAT
jgi:hypothetical protein